MEVLVTANTAQAQAALAKLNAEIKGTSASGAAAGGALGKVGKAGAAAGVVIAAAAVHMAADFKQQMTLIETQAGASKGEIDKLTGSVLKLATESEFGPTELAKGLFRLESQGYRGAKAMEALKQSVDLASVGQVDLETATGATAAAVQSGIKGTETFRKTVGVLNAAVGQGAMRMNDLVGALGTGILPSARSAGLSLKDVTAALGVMTRVGVPASAAATRLRMTFSLMSAPTDAAKKSLASIGLSSTDLAKEMRKPEGLVKAVDMLKEHLSGVSKIKANQKISEIFGGGRTSSGILTLLSNSKDLADIYEKTGEKSKEFGEAVEQQEHTTNAAFERLASTVQAAMIALGSALDGPVGTALTYLMDELAKAIDATDEFLNHTKDGKQLVKDFGDTMAGIGFVIEKGVIPALKTLLPFIKDQFGGLIKFVRGFFKIFGGIARGDWSAVWDGLKLVVVGFLQGFRGYMKLMLVPFIQTGKMAWSVFGKPVSAAFHAVKNAVVWAVDKILGAYSSLIGAAGDVADELSKIPVVGKKFKGLADGAHAAQKKIDDLRDSLKGNDKQLNVSQDKIQVFTKKGRANFQAFSRGSGNAFGGLRDKVHDGTSDISGDFSSFGKKAHSLNVKVSGNVGDLSDTTFGAFKAIAENANSSLKAFNAPQLDFSWKTFKQLGGSLPGKQMGGGLAAQVPGTAPGDRHLLSLNGQPIAKVESKEGIFVGNKNLMGTLSAANAAVPRFQQGGMPKVGFTGPGGATTNLGHNAVDRVQKAAEKYVQKHASNFGTGKGVNFQGREIADWILPILKYAQRNGWAGSITSGYRPPDQVVSNSSGIVAPQGQSNHNSLAYPGGAIDVGDPTARAQGSALNAALQGYPGKPPLVWGGPVINDWGHFSADGHMSGGPVVRIVGQDLIEKHAFNLIAASGILGNAYREAGPEWNSESVGTGGGGLWGFTAGAISLANLQAAAAEKGVSWGDPKFQTHFMLKHGGFGLRDTLNAADSPEKAAELFMDLWEHPGIEALGDRQHGARLAYNMLKSQDYSEGGGGGQSPQQKAAIARKKEREAEIKKLRKAVGKADTKPGRQSALWELISAYTKDADFSGKEQGHVVDAVRKAAGVVNPLGNVPILQNLAKWMGEHGEITGHKLSDDLHDKVHDAHRNAGKHAAKVRNKKLQAISNSGADYPLKGSLRASRGEISRIQELVDVAVTRAGFSTSEAGADTGDAEALSQIGLNKAILALQEQEVRQVNKSMEYMDDQQKKFKHLTKVSAPATSKLHWKHDSFKEALSGANDAMSNLKTYKNDLVGVTGMGGDILQTREALDNLGVIQAENAAKKAEATQINGFSISDILEIADAAKYGVFDSLPRAHTGATIEGPAGAEAAVVVRSGESIVPNEQMGANVTIEFADGMGWLEEFVTVKIEQNSRKVNHKIRAGAKR